MRVSPISWCRKTVERFNYFQQSPLRNYSHHIKLGSGTGINDLFGFCIIHVYVVYVYQSRKSWKKLWRQLATDQLDFRLRCNLSHDTSDLGFYDGLVSGNRQMYWSCKWAFSHSKKNRRSLNKNAWRKRKTLHWHVIKCAISTRLVRSIVLHYYVNEFGKYLTFS